MTDEPVHDCQYRRRLERLTARLNRDRSDWADHGHGDHVITGDARERERRIIARHLCGWITGHAAPVDHFLIDADLIFEDIDKEEDR